MGVPSQGRLGLLLRPQLLLDAGDKLELTQLRYLHAPDYTFRLRSPSTKTASCPHPKW